MDTGCQKRVRQLYGWEIQEFHDVFGDTLRYQDVRIHECAAWPDQIDRLGRKLKGMAPPKPGDHNAITLGNHCLFPVQMPTSLPGPGDPESYKMDWLVHELTHAWQYQHLGWNYLLKAVRAQLREKEQAYDYGGQDGLLKSRTKSKLFKDFNPEQQGNIAQTYYLRKRMGKDVEAWAPYIEELKKRSG